MNERIKELMIQSGMVSEVVGNPNGLWTTKMSVKTAEKFAELIVGECLEACSRANEIRHFVPPTQEQVVLNCMREIETTFRS